jgi:hypothetical protein
MASVSSFNELYAIQRVLINELCEVLFARNCGSTWPVCPCLTSSTYDILRVSINEFCEYCLLFLGPC